MGSALYYEIRVAGHFGSAQSDWFACLSHQNLPCGEAVLVVQVSDQAALHGVLARVRDLNLTLIAVRRIQGPAE